MSLDPEDIRIKHVQITSQQILKYDSSCWKDVIWKEETQTIMKDFFDVPTTLTLFIYFKQNYTLVLSTELSKVLPLPFEICYFLKKSSTVSMTEYKQELAFGNIYDFPLLQYQYILGKVLAPIFTNTLSNRRWPLETSHDICHRFQDFQMTLSYHIGLAEKKTVLVIPERAKLIQDFNIDELSESAVYDWELCEVLNSVTEMLSRWFPVVREVLELTTENVMSTADQSPLTEISFWNDRKENLEFIFTQMNKPLIKKMVLTLEKTKNCHFPKFKTLLQEVAEALDEAKDVCQNFNFMFGVINKLEHCTLAELVDLLPESIKSIITSWLLSKYYRSLPSRITVLLKKCCYFIIEKIQMFLDPMTLFQVDRKKAKDNIQLSVDVANIFIKSYYQSRDELQDAYENKLYPWDFPDERVFTKFEIYVQRLDDINDLFLAADVYFSITSYKLLSVQHADYNKRLDEIHLKFCKLYAVFEDCSYNPLDVDSADFTQDYKSFTVKLNEIDHKLGIIIAQACLTCAPPEDSFKLVDVLQELIKRPVVEYEFKKLVSSHVENIYEDMLDARQSYNDLLIFLDKTNEGLIYKNLPAVSGAIQWIIDLKKKVSLSIESLQNMQQYFPTFGAYQFVLKIHDELLDLLKKLEENTISEWRHTLESFQERLDDVLFVTDDKNLVTLNFNSQICEMTREIQYLKHIKTADLVPNYEIKWLSDTFLPAQSLLASSIWWYRDLNKSIGDYHTKLISSQWDDINSYVEDGYSKKWTNPDLLSFSKNMYNGTKEVYENVKQAKLNELVIETFINTWTSTPMFTRSSPNSLVDFEICMTSEVRNVKEATEKTSELIENIMQENQKLFGSDTFSYEWKAYVSYLESIFEDGLKKAAKCSLEYLVENTDSSNKKLAPFYKISMSLEDNIIFKPPLDESEPRNFMQLFEAVIEKIYSPSKEVKRMNDTYLDYYDAVVKDQKLKSLLDSLNQNLTQGIKKATSVAEEFNLYADLWLKDIDEDLKDFTFHGPIPEIEVLDEDEDTEIDLVLQEMKPPTEDEFKMEIANFDKLFKIVDNIENIIEVESWLILDVTSFKDNLLQTIRKWHSAYKKKFIELKQLGKLSKLDDDSDL